MEMKNNKLYGQMLRDGGPAFPYSMKNGNSESVYAFGFNIPSGATVNFSGMTMRDYFAANAPIDLQTAINVWGDKDADVLQDGVRHTFLAVWSMLRYEWADAMIEARGGNK